MSHPFLISYAAASGVSAIAADAAPMAPWAVVTIALLAPVVPVTLGYLLTRKRQKRMDAAVQVEAAAAREERTEALKHIQQIQVNVDGRLTKLTGDLEEALGELQRSLQENVRLKDDAGIHVTKPEREAAEEGAPDPTRERPA
jgi:membrane protein implicated in regulation of membrane protease activity